MQNKDEPLLKRPIWKKQRIKNLLIDCQNVLQYNTVFKLKDLFLNIIFKDVFPQITVADINSNIVYLKPLMSLLSSYTNKLCAYMQHTPIFMVRTCVYKGIVETHMFLTKMNNT